VVCGAHTGNGVEMQDVDQAFLLAFAGVSGTLLGTFVVGVFFYIDSEMHMRLEVSEAADRYQRSSIRWVFTAYSIALFVPLTFAALHPLWGSLAFGLFGVVLLAMTVDCVRRILAKGASGSSRALVANQWLSSVVLVAALVLPWALGGWVPPPGAFVPSLLLLLATGFSSTAALIMAQFDATMGMVDETIATASPAGTDAQRQEQ